MCSGVCLYAMDFISKGFGWTRWYLDVRIVFLHAVEYPQHGQTCSSYSSITLATNIKHQIQGKLQAFSVSIMN